MLVRILPWAARPAVLQTTMGACGFVLATLLLSPCSGTAQGLDDPFGGAAGAVDPFGAADDNPFGGAAPLGGAAAFGEDPDRPSAGEPAAASEEDPLTIQLLESSARGDAELAASIESLARLERWTEVEQLLSQLSGRTLNDAQRAQMAAQIEPAVFLKLKQQSLSESARAELEKLAAAAITEAESPQRLQQAIDGLDSPSMDTRLASARVLLSGGNAAIAQLVMEASSANPSAPRDDILRVLLRLGDGGLKALRQLALYGDPTVRQYALLSLARISRSMHVPELVTAIHAADSSDAEVEMAAAQLSRIRDGRLSRQAAIEILNRDFENKKSRAELTDNDDAVTTAWVINEDRSGITYRPASALLEAYREVADAARRLRRIGLPPQLVGSVLAADVAYRVLVDPDWGDPDQLEVVRQAYGAQARGSALSSAIGQSLEENNHAATIGLIRLIDQQSASVLDRSLLLSGDGSQPAPLVRAASSSDPRVRYEAALAAATLADGAPCVGSSQVMRTLSEMRLLTDRPTALLVETRRDAIVQLENLLTDLGFNVELVSSVAQAQREVARGGDLRLILSKTELVDLPAIEMIDRVRRLDRGREVPIIFYGADAAGIQSDRWEAPTTLINRPSSVAALKDVMDRVRRQQRLPELTEIDRQIYRQAASELLAGLASSG